ncbi:MAG: PH domain-containing protein [Flavobacteriales bacterium]|nr:PH domain-containing protein [Flavobacteriales bacterium]
MKPNHSTESMESALSTKVVFHQKPLRGAWVYASVLYLLIAGIMAYFTGSFAYGALPVWAFMVFGIYGFRYIIENDRLTIRQWSLYAESIAISEITSIAPVRGYFGNFMADPERLEIRYSNCMRMRFAPKDRSGLVEALKVANPDIEVDESL